MSAEAEQSGCDAPQSGRPDPRLVPGEISSGRLVPRFVVAAALLAACAGVFVLWRLRSARAMDDDELQHMHFAWCLTQGLVPYRDFWDNHPPLLHHILRSLIRQAGESSAAFVLARAWMFAFAVPAIGATFLLGRMCFNTGAGLLAAAWLACSEVFLLKAIEIRPDGLMTGLNTMGLALLAAGLRAKGQDEAFDACSPSEETAGRTSSRLGCAQAASLMPRGALQLLAAGTFFGLACVLGTKSAVVFVMAVGAVAGALVSQPGRSRRDGVVRVSVAAAGFLIPPGIWIALAMFDGSAGSALRMTLWENLSYPQRFSPWSLIASTQPYALLAAAALGALSIFQRALPPATRSARAFVASCAALTTLAYATMPAAYLQSALIALPSLCALAGAGTLWVIQGLGADRPGADRRGTARRGTDRPGENRAATVRLEADRPVATRWRGAISMAGCAAFLALAVLRPLWRVEQAAAQQAPQWIAALAVVDELQQRTGPQDVVFDGRCEAVFRPHAYFYPALVQGVLTRYREGAVQPRVAEALSRRPASVVLRDSRTAKLPQEDWDAITSQYVAMPPPWEWILLPGWTLEPPDAGAVEVVTAVSAPVEGIYTVQRKDTRTRVFVNDAEVAEQARLIRGRHTVRLVAPMAPVTISRFPGQTPADFEAPSQELDDSP
ncbi:MAG: hypothetical protein IT449_18020 [Phycisphaerales bacterium]|nr:hypothetical protein [Phycisphaerales bacterium]